jgi:hypothetical protein
MNSDDSAFVDPLYILPPDLLHLPNEVVAKITRSINYTTRRLCRHPQPRTAAD